MTTPTPADCPADLLRAAADLLRAAGRAATPGPWRRPLNTRYRCSVTGPLPEGERGNWIDGIDPATEEREQVTVATIPIWSTGKHSRQRGGRDLEYIALVHPGVGLALAAWLDRAAVEYDATVRGAAGVWSESGEERERDAWVERQTNPHALAVARQLLGTTAAAECGKTVGVSGLFYRPCARPAGHPEAYCRDASGDHMFLAAALPAPADRAAVLREAADAVLDIIGTEARLPQTISGVYRAADHLRALAADAAAGVQPPTSEEHPEDCTCGPHQLARIATPPAAPADGTRCTCGGRFPTFHLHADTHEPEETQ
ncbi:hypothetical protein ACIQJW_08135 [Streptomyces californicus]|uniref:hypothetical protein n=1 Tax=Streptomyces californicus TaxID=67351 RepID=UPI003829411A